LLLFSSLNLKKNDRVCVSFKEAKSNGILGSSHLSQTAIAHFASLEQQIIMSHTSFTAVIFTFHNWSALAALICAFLLSFFVYFLVIKKFSHQLLAIIITFALACITSQALMEKLFLQKPWGVEIVKAG
jgi:hypothetical protein